MIRGATILAIALAVTGCAATDTRPVTGSVGHVRTAKAAPAAAAAPAHTPESCRARHLRYQAGEHPDGTADLAVKQRIDAICRPLLDRQG